MRRPHKSGASVLATVVFCLAFLAVDWSIADDVSPTARAAAAPNQSTPTEEPVSTGTSTGEPSSTETATGEPSSTETATGEPSVSPSAASTQVPDPSPSGSATAASVTPGDTTPTQGTTPATPAEPTPTRDGTAVVEPDPPPGPLHLPVTYLNYDRRAPEPVKSEATGYLDQLAEFGRDRCLPATHIVFRDKERTEALAVVFANSDEPALELDLYLGERVLVRGSESLPGPECTVAPRLLAVTEIEVVEDPPGR